MEMHMFEVGSKIRIISKANVRYEGIFVEIDKENLQIALANVHFYGTESRDADFFIAGQTRTYPVVVFRSSDIKDIQVIEKAAVPGGEFDFDALPSSLEDSGRMSSFLNSSCASTATERMSSFFSNSSGISVGGDSGSMSRHVFPNIEKINARRSMMMRCGGNHDYRCAQQRYNAPYLWRIPRVVHYVGRSGDPKELPLKTNSELMSFDREYDFEKYNKLFEELCGGLADLSMSSSAYSEHENTEEEKPEPPKQQQQQEQQKQQQEQQPDKDKEKENPIQNVKENIVLVKSSSSSSNNDFLTDKVDKAVTIVAATVSKGAIPKKVDVFKSPKSNTSPSPTAYDKSKSFFDSVSCSSIYRSSNRNLNWRERNTETFGVPMICHQRRARVQSSSAKPETEASKSNSQTEEVNTDEGAGGNTTTIQQKVTVKKVQFKAVFYTKTSTPKKEEKKHKNQQSQVDMKTETDESLN